MLTAIPGKIPNETATVSVFGLGRVGLYKVPIVVLGLAFKADSDDTRLSPLTGCKDIGLDQLETRSVT